MKPLYSFQGIPRHPCGCTFSESVPRSQLQGDSRIKRTRADERGVAVSKPLSKDQAALKTSRWPLKIICNKHQKQEQEQRQEQGPRSRTRRAEAGKQTTNNEIIIKARTKRTKGRVRASSAQNEATTKCRQRIQLPSIRGRLWRGVWAWRGVMKKL